MIKLLTQTLDKLSVKDVIEDVYGDLTDMLIETGQYTLIESNFDEKKSDNPSSDRRGANGTSGTASNQR